MADGIAQHVLKSRRHAIQHATVHINRATDNVELYLLACLFCGLPNHAVKPVRNTFKLNHTGAQQVALQLTGLAALRNQIVFGPLHGSLQTALYSGDVIDRFGHHARQFLHPGKAVKFQRIEVLRGVLGLGQSRLHLGFGLQLHVTQLLTQPVQIAIKLHQRRAQLHQMRLHA